MLTRTPEPDEREYTASDGAVLRYRVWEPRSPERGAFLLFNGVMSHSLWFGPLVPKLTAAGWRMIGADRRGSGPNVGARGDAPSASQLVDDAVVLAEQERFGEKPGVVVGWCWGAALAISVCARLQPRPAGLVLVTPGLQPTSAVTEALAKTLEAKQSGRDASDAWIPTPIAEEMFTRGPALDDFVRQDPQRLASMSERMVAISRQLGSVAVPRLSKLCAEGLPVAVVLAADDEATDNAATRALLARLPSENVHIHELPGAHGVQFEQPERLAEHLLEAADGSR